MTPETPPVPSGPLRVLLLAWEYPPVMVGGLGRHVHALATQLAVAGHAVTVVTRHAPGLPVDEMRGGVRVVRAPEDPPPFPLATSSLLAWTMAFNHALTRAALRAAATAEFDVIHAHDWLVTHTAVTLTEHLRLPLVATIHATEAGRHQGWLPEEMNRCIHAVEWWLAREASRMLVCSEYMKWEVTRLLELHDAAVEVIPNGVDDRRWRAPRKAVERARERFTAHDGPLVVYAGRLVYEKGVQDLISALPTLRDRHPGLRLVIAGDGPHRTELAEHCARIGQDVEFCGFMEEVDLAALLAVADAVVVPSLYEPFGMVALEASAAGAPLAAAATGGLLAIVQHGKTGLAFPPADPAALADAVTRLLEDPKAAKRMVAKARAMIRKNYLWPTIAATTAQAYAAAIDEASVLSPRVAGVERPAIVVPEGNLLALAATP